ncbi:MAG: pyridoxamine 5'-phosphate oxidase family protein [Nocardioides sp.]|nr:pyridoxamine 5'-phosphate oxidase family protein [Nocardioides sp.]
MPHTSPTRFPEMMSTSRADLDALLDSTVLGHVGFVDDGHPVVIPTAVVRWGDRLLAHGSTGSRWLRKVARGVPVSVSIAAIDGVVVARSAFESSLLYRSAVCFGAFAPVQEPDLREALDVFTSRLLPGRTGEVRPSTAKELAATLLLSMPLDDWSLRISDEWPDDPAADVAGDAWAGQIRFGEPPMAPYGAPDLRLGIPVPASVRGVHGVR